MKWTCISIGLGILALAGFRVALRDRTVTAEPIDAPRVEDPPVAVSDSPAPAISVEAQAASQSDAPVDQLDALPQATESTVDYRVFSRAGPRWVEQHPPPRISP